MEDVLKNYLPLIPIFEKPPIEFSAKEAKMYFALSNGDSNAIQMTNYLSDSIYNLAINKGESARGTVAFLHRSDSKEPLQFIGFGKNIQFNLEQIYTRKSNKK